MRRRLPPLPGRFWRVEALIAMAGGALAVAVPVWYLSSQLALDEELGLSTHTDIELGAGLGLAFLLFSAFFVHYATRDLYRWRTRRTALLTGSDADIPPAHALTIVAEPTDVSQRPLELLWHAAPSLQIFALLLVAFFLLELAFCVVVVVASAVLLIRSGDSTSFAVRVLAVAGDALFMAALIAVSVYLARLIPTFFGRPYGVVASDAGLECRTQVGRRFTIAWSDARLFEIEKKSRARTFYLYGTREVAMWRVMQASSSEFGFAPTGIDGPEMALRLDALNALIVARTGLTLRTFSRSLRRAVGPRPAKSASFPSPSWYVGSAVLVLVSFATAAATLLSPPMSVGTLGETLAIAPTIMGLFLLGLMVRAAVQRLAGQRQSPEDRYQPRPVDSMPPAAPDTVFSFQEHLSTLQRIGCAAFGVLALPALIPFVALLAPFLAGSFAGPFSPGAPAINSSIYAYAVDFLLGIYGGCGLFALWAAWRGMLGRSLRADKEGIGAGNNRLAVAIPWAAIDRITARREGQSSVYVIYGARTRILVRDNPRRRHLLYPMPGTSAIMPAELAALASERSGKPIKWL